MIAFRDVTVQYPRAATAAVRGVSLTAARGRITAIVGPNGSGKSTLVRALLARHPLAGGRITIDDLDATRLPRRALARAVSVVSQREEPIFPMPVRDYVALGRYPHTGPWRAARQADRLAVDRALNRAGVAALARRPTDELSGGEWQRARIARALAQEADAIVLDEPTTFLDVGHEMALFELLDTLARDGRAVLLVSHQLNLVARFAAEMVLLHRGELAATGEPSAVMRGDTLERVYEWPVVVTRDPAVGAPALVPLRTHPPRR